MRAKFICVPLLLALVAAPAWSQNFGERLKNALLGTQPAQAQGDYIGPRRGYVDGQGSVKSMECYEKGGRDFQYPAGIQAAQRDLAQNPNHPFASDELASVERACGPLPKLYTEQEHRQWLTEQQARNARFSAAHEGSEQQKQDKAMLRLLEPVVEGHEPGSHTCNAEEKKAYANAKSVISGGYNSGYSKNELDSAHMLVDLIEHRCGNER